MPQTGVAVLVLAMTSAAAVGADAGAPADAGAVSLTTAPRGSSEDLGAVAAAHAARGDHATAAWVLREALDVLPADPLAAPLAEPRLRAALAVQLADTGDLAGAEDALARALESPALAGPDGRGLRVNVSVFLSSLVLARGEALRAEALLRAALQAATTSPPLEGTVIAEVSSALAALLVQGDRLGEAHRLAKQAERHLERAGRASGDEFLRVLDTLALVGMARGDLDGALGHLRRAARLAAIGGARPSTRASIALHHGTLAQALGDYAEAEIHLEIALEQGTAAVGAGHPTLVRVLQALADCYCARGRREDAAGLHREAIRIAERAYGPGTAVGAASRDALEALAPRPAHQVAEAQPRN